MIKQVLKQIWKQRGENGWIYLELLIVFILFWYVVDYSFMMVHNRLLPRGFNIENTYRVYHDDINSEEKRDEFAKFVRKVKQYPGVEKVTLSNKYEGTTPFSSSYSSRVLKRDTNSDAISMSAEIKRVTSPDYFSIFEIRSVTHSDRTGALDFSNSSSIVLSEDLAKGLFADEDPIGKAVYMGKDDIYIVTDVVGNQKKYDYETYTPTFFISAKEESVTMPELSLRVNDHFSIDKFREDVSYSILSYHNVKKTLEMINGTTMEVQLRMIMMLFFVLSTALGVIGTFWFRNQARRNEIGVRMSMGSSRKEVLRQFVTEAILLLTLAAIPAMVVIAVILHLDIIEVIGILDKDSGHYLIENIWLRGLITVAITYILMAVIVGVSAWIPARRAARVNPVEALRDE